MINGIFSRNDMNVPNDCFESFIPLALLNVLLHFIVVGEPVILTLISFPWAVQSDKLGRCRAVTH
jgi:hypothetical protein